MDLISTLITHQKTDDLIKGELKFSDKTVSIKLSEEHGGCWNVMTFANDFSYIVKGDIVYIDKIEGDWFHCTYFGKTTSEGWITKESLNKILNRTL